MDVFDDSDVAFDRKRYLTVLRLEPGDRVMVCVMDFAVTATYRPGTVLNIPPRQEGPREYSFPVQYVSGGKTVMGFFNPHKFEVYYDTLLNSEDAVRAVMR